MIGKYKGINEANFFDARRNHIIGIGINEYKFLNHLEYCQSDLECFYKVVIDYYDCFEEDRITSIFSKLNEQPTKKKILDTLKNKISCLTCHDNVVLYFAGHGVSEDGMYYFATYNSKKEDLNSFISFKELLRLLERQDIKHVLLIVDACYGGKILSVDRSFSEGGLEENSEFWKRIYTKKSIWVLTSGGIEKVKDKSPFADIMLKVLESFGKNQKPITISEIQSKIIRFLSSKVTQTPMVGRINGVEGFNNNEGEFVFFPRPIPDQQEQEINIKENEQSIQTKSKESIFVPPIVQFPKIIEDSKTPITTEITINDDDIITLEPIFNSKGLIANPKNKNIWFKQVLATLALFLLILLAWYENIINSKELATKDISVDTSIVMGAAIYSQYPEVSDTIPTKKIVTSIPKKKKWEKATLSNQISKIDSTPKNNLVFVGSFENKENAINLINRLKGMGYKEAEIVMKENLPFATVVSGFHHIKSSAKSETKVLKKSGFEVYTSHTDLTKIYRSK